MPGKTWLPKYKVGSEGYCPNCRAKTMFADYYLSLKNGKTVKVLTCDKCGKVIEKEMK